jgi:hypothetical protein
MKQPLSAPQAKIERARKHLAEFEAEAAAYLKKSPPQFSGEQIQGPDGLAFNFALFVTGPPEVLGTIIGDVIHNLRTALDITACELVRIAGESDVDVYFPFCRDASVLEEMIQRRHFDRAGPHAMSLLRSLKPYREGNAALRAIHDLDIQDKHRNLIPNAVAVAGPVIQMWEDDGTINPRIIGDPNLPSEVKLVFPNGLGLDGLEVIPTLRELVVLIDKTVDAFRAIANREDQ